MYWIINILNYSKNLKKELNSNIINTLNNQILSIIIEKQIRKNNNINLIYEEKIDEINNDFINEIEIDLYNNIVDLISTFCKIYKNNYITLFEKKYNNNNTLLNICSKLLNIENIENNISDIIFSLSIFTEIIEHCGNNSNKYINNIIIYSINILNNINKFIDYPLLIQTICYLIGVISLKKQLNNNNIINIK